MSYYPYARTSVLLIAAITIMAGCSSSIERQPSTTLNINPPMNTLVTAEWLKQQLNDPNIGPKLIVLDCTVLLESTDAGGFRSVNGRAHYTRGHIPTAGFADLFGDLSDNDSPYEFALPDPEQFAAAMRALGVSDDSRVVLYDANRSVWAARVWWMLRWIGFDRAALLDGGLQAWRASDGELSTEPARHPAGKLTLALRPALIADRNEVLASINKDDVNIIDALPKPHYRGTMSMYARPGHISGASNVPATSLVDDTGRLLPRDALSLIHI